MATEILSSLFQDLEAISKSAFSHSSVALPPSSLFTLDTPGTTAHPSPQFLSLGTLCPQTLCHVSSSPLFFFSKSRVTGPQPSGSWGRGGSQGPLAQDDPPHLLTQGHSEEGQLPVLQI